MITYKEIYIVSHDDPRADEYREYLTKEGDWIITEDTRAVTYTRTIWFPTRKDLRPKEVGEGETE